MTKRGRPKKQPHELRTSRLPAVRLTTAERIDLDQKAARAGVDLCEWVRQQLTAAPVKRMTTKRVDASLITELSRLSNEQSRIGNNVNQIAYALNSGQGEDPHHIDAILAQLWASNDQLQNLLEEVATRYGS